MRLKPLTAMIFSIAFVAAVAAQHIEVSFESANVPQAAIKVDEFGRTGECDAGARIDNIFIQLNNNPSSHAVIIVYRGTKDLPARQTDEFVKKQFDWLQRPVRFRRYDPSMLTLVDGGFRDSTSLTNEAFLVPQGVADPQPSEAVEAPSIPTDRAFKVDEIKYNEVISAAYIQQEQDQADEQASNEEQASEEQSVDESNASETGNSSGEEPVAEEGEVSTQEEDYTYYSTFLASRLESEPADRGVIIYYADPDEFDLSKSRTFMEEHLHSYASKFKLDPARLQLVYGGYKKDTSVEYWLVPTEARDPEPTPDVKESKIAEVPN